MGPQQAWCPLDLKQPGIKPAAALLNGEQYPACCRPFNAAGLMPLRSQVVWDPIGIKPTAAILSDLQQAEYFLLRSCIHHLQVNACRTLWFSVWPNGSSSNIRIQDWVYMFVGLHLGGCPNCSHHYRKLQFSLWICHLVLLHKQKKNSQFTCLLQTPSNTVWDMSQKNQTNVIHWVISIEVEPVAA